MKNRKDPWIQGDIDDAKTFAVLLESTKRSILSSVDCFDSRRVWALLSFKPRVENGNHYRAEQTRYSTERPCNKDFSNARTIDAIPTK
jgi:hypothetical protein